MARYLGVSKEGLIVFGSYMFLVLVINMITGLADIGVSTAFEREIASGTAEKEVVGTYIIYRFITTGLVAFVIILFSQQISQFFNINDVFAVQIAALIPVVWVPTRVFARLNIAKGRTLYSQLPNIIEYTLRTILISYSAIFIKTTSSLMLSFLYAALICSILSFVLLFMSISKFNWLMLKKMFLFSLPIGVANAIGYFSQMADNFLISIYGSVFLLGLYSISKGFLGMLLIIPGIITTLLFPDLVSFFKSHGNGDALANRFITIQRYFLVIIAPLVLFIIVYRVNLLHILYSNAFIVVSPEVVILTISVIPQGYLYMYSTFLMAIDKQRFQLYFTILKLLITISISIVLIPSIGMLGAALAVLFSSIITASISIVVGYEFLKLYPDIKSVVIILFSASASFVALALINHIIPLNRWYDLLSVWIIGFIIYFIILSILREFRKNDVDTLLKPLGIPSFIIHIIKKLFPS